MAKVRNNQLHVTTSDLKKFMNDYGLNNPLKKGEMRITDRNGQTRTFNLKDEAKKFEGFMQAMGIKIPT